MKTAEIDLEHLGALTDQGIPNLFYFWHDLESLPKAFHENLDFAEARYPEWIFSILTDVAAHRLLERDWPEIAKEYNDIWIPACRSDIARLAALYAFGGWYLDADTLPTGDLRPLTGDTNVIVFRDTKPRLKQRGDVMNGFLYMPRGSDLARAMLEQITKNLRERKDVYRVMDFAGPYLMARLIKEMDPSMITVLWQSEVYRRYNELFVGDTPLFEHTVDATASSWRIVQNFGVLPGLEPNWDGFPLELRPRFARVIREFVTQHGLQKQLVELAHHRPLYLERAQFKEFVEECRG
ncbi:glycosyltransferase [Roseobacter sp. HKCCD6490]|uniref:glycosyltransferase n=1 Tax=Roseobacter sp. HKCCD6490 TaxID=2690594 RepID=UPI0015521D38|nr:glycosyltransferase [Roseobacter sp. HKCCD6490]NPU05967.1 hypothetical protein [Roseobacter sp. HKCCD6490]